MKKRHFNAGYSIIEVVAVLVLLVVVISKVSKK